MRKLELKEYSSEWNDKYLYFEELICGILSDCEIHHIGSTSIANIVAKPIIDILVQVEKLDIIDVYNDQFILNGFIPMGEYGVKGRRYFIYGNNERRDAHIHIFQKDDEQILRHLRFRDFLILHPKYAKEYSDLKIQIKKKVGDNIKRYIDLKSDFIGSIDKKAYEFFERISPGDSLCFSVINLKDKNEYEKMIENWNVTGERKVPFVLDFVYNNFSELVTRIRGMEKIENVQNGFVESTTLLLRNKHKEIVAVTNVRHRLNENLTIHGGHIGYGVNPKFRNRGYAKLILSLALDFVKQFGVKKALLTCDKDNLFSKRTIMSQGGVLDESIISNELRFFIEIGE
jgi:predicted acetyltransferase/GrpB-like predicted nucleotidyltransferase (UPF0157 family)